MSLTPRRELAGIDTCPHGGVDQAEMEALGTNPEAVIDFSVCTNPFMPPPGTRRVLRNIAINRYPDSGATEFRRRLSAGLGVAPDNILAGSGTTELIRLIALAYFGKGEPVLTVEPTFGEYEIAARILGAGIISQWAGEETGLVPPIAETIALIRRHRPRAVFICNPNNPTGKYLSRAEVEAVLHAVGDGLLILDEAYRSFVEETWPSLDLIAQGNVAILRSMTKDWGLAGLRLGYAVAGRDIIANLRRVCPPWNVNTAAQAAGAFCLEQGDYLKESQRKIGDARKLLVGELTRLGFQVLPSDAHFFLVRVGNARGFRAALLEHNMLVRDCTSFGLPEYVRIAPRTMPECRRLIRAIRELKKKKGNGAPYRFDTGTAPQ